MQMVPCYQFFFVSFGFLWSMAVLLHLHLLSAFWKPTSHCLWSFPASLWSGESNGKSISGLVSPQKTASRTLHADLGLALLSPCCLTLVGCLLDLQHSSSSTAASIFTVVHFTDEKPVLLPCCQSFQHRTS